MPDKKRPNLCIVGQLVGRNQGFITTQGQILADALEREGFEVVSVSSKLNRILRLVDVLRTILRGRAKFELLIIEVYSGLSFVLSDLASCTARFLNLPVVFVLHGGNLPEFRMKFPGWTRRVFSRAKALVAPSSFLAEELSSFVGPVTVIPNVIDLDVYTYRLRSRLHPRLFWMRSFHSIYDPELAINAFHLLTKQFPEATLVMAGPDKGALNETVRLANKLGVADRVRFPGFLNDDQKAEEFGKADIFLNTNRIDNMPVSVVEACAAGLPVVATEVGGLSKLLINRTSGLLVKAGDARAISDAVEELLRNPELADNLSRNGRAVAEASAWPNVYSKWTELFSEILAPQSRLAVPASENLEEQKA